jgi:hypothetical protein
MDRMTLNVLILVFATTTGRRENINPPASQNNTNTGYVLLSAYLRMKLCYPFVFIKFVRNSYPLFKTNARGL